MSQQQPQDDQGVSAPPDGPSDPIGGPAPGGDGTASDAAVASGGATEPAPPAGAAPATQRMVDIGPHLEFVQVPGSGFECRFAPLGLVATGPDQDSAGRALVAMLQEAMQDDALRSRWEAFAEAHAQEVPAEQGPPIDVTEALNAIEPIDPEKLDDVLDGHPLVLVDFWATWCQPCLAMAPELAKLQEHLGEQLSIRKLDVDQAPDVAERFEVKSIPCMVLFRDGGEVTRIVGAQPADQVLRQIQPHLAGA